MKILITGGGGFLGARLARTLLATGQLDGKAVSGLMLTDQQAPPADLVAQSNVHVRTGPLLAQVADLAAWQPDAVFHLASAVSGECEDDFDLGLRSNIDSTRALLDAFRHAKHAPRFVFSSSVAVYGPDAGHPQAHLRAFGQRLHPQGLHRWSQCPLDDGHRAPRATQWSGVIFFQRHHPRAFGG